MYPFLRMLLAMWRVRRFGKLDISQTYESRHIILPQDIDLFGELNNGRMLTILDLSRHPFGHAVGLVDAVRKNNWGLTMAGVSVRYRRRVKMFDRVRITTHAVGRDTRFFYLVQTMWKGEEAACNALYRAAVYTRDGLVSPDELAAALGASTWNPELPNWVKAWIEAEGQREWPPEN